MKRIAIVNRGEAAGRCIRAIKELRLRESSGRAGRATGSPDGLIAIALYTDPDANAPFVRQADVAISIGSALRTSRDGRTRLAYLDHTRVLAALRAVGADAVWPGWGFVSEDADFVEALEDRGITFVGPSSQTIRMVGDKISAKKLAQSAGVPVAPWSNGPVENDVETIASEIGYPLLIKASAGGGGRGIRLVQHESELAAALASARSEARNAFGDDAVYLEAIVERPRHIEVQIAADTHGTIASFGLRDCSVQRRHQKVVEESPPAGLPPSTASAIEEAAIEIARRAKYRGVGTVEFLVTEDLHFVFLEVNPRLQVEHGVTEAVTGCDLVVAQLLIARGDRIPSPGPTRGHAIEARICAEDPERQFSPAPGTIALLDLPTGPGIRTDCSAAAGTTIPSEFDSLVAKVIAHGESRPAAMARLQAALGDLRLMVAGGATNRSFLLNMLEDREYRAGGVDIGWLDRRIDSLAPSRLAAEALVVASILAYLRERATQRLNFFAEASRGEPQSIPTAHGKTVDLTHRGTTYKVRVLALGDWQYRVELGSSGCTAELRDHEPFACQLVIGESRHTVEYVEGPSSLQLEVDGHRHAIDFDTGGEVRAAAPSVVVAIKAGSGERVDAGQQIGVLETMKIEIALLAPISGTIGEIRVRPNQRVAAGDVLLLIQAEDEQSDKAPVPITLPDDSAKGDPFEAVYADDRFVREQGRQEIHNIARRVLLGYDTEADDVSVLRAFFDSPLPTAPSAEVVNELGEIRALINVFADIEVLFSRRQSAAPEAGTSRSNDAELRRYLQRIEAGEAGLDDHFNERLKAALRHYKIQKLDSSEPLQRALLRLYAARRQRRERHGLVEAILRHLGRLVQAGLRPASDPTLEASLRHCLVLRGDVPDALADAAAEIRAAFFEAPEVERRTQLAEQTVASVLARIEQQQREVYQSAAAGDTMTRSSLSDLDQATALAASAPQIFDALLTQEADTARQTLALQALILRLYAPATPLSAAVAARAKYGIVRLELSDQTTVAAVIARPGHFADTWTCLMESGCCSSTDRIEIIVHLAAPTSPAALRDLAAQELGNQQLDPWRVTFTALHRNMPETAVSYSDGQWSSCHDLHPRTPKRIGLDRLAGFSLERLSAPRSTFAFFGKSTRQPSDQRIFIFGEVHAAVPGFAGTLHEASFVSTFTQAVRTLRRLRAEEPAWQRLHWNRIVLQIRPSFHLAPETLQRLIDELLPATNHLGLERIIVQLELRESEGNASKSRELVIEPALSGRPRIAWRAPHREPLQPADRHAQRVAAARRRGLVYPYEAIRMFAEVRHGLHHFVEYDLDEKTGKPVSVDRPPGQNLSAIVFGRSIAGSALHPNGIERITILSDPTHHMGALTSAETTRIVAAIEMAEIEQIPLEWLATSGGARIAMDSGTENLDAVAEVVRKIVRFTQSGGEINVIVAGINVGAQSYFDALATMLMHTRGILIMTHAGAMVLTGKRALEASGGVSAEDENAIGGYEDIMGPNGQAQYYAETVEQAFGILMRHYELTYVVAEEAHPRRAATSDPPGRNIANEPFVTDGGHSSPTTETVADYLGVDRNPDRKKPFAIRPVMRALIDRDADALERWAGMRGAETAVVWDTRLGGHAICLIGVENRAIPRDRHPPPDGPAEWAGATLFPGSAKKIARALNAASGQRTAVILANLAGFDGSPESMRELQLEYGAEIARAVVNFRTKLLFVVTSRYHGGAYVVFSTRLNPNVHALALQGSFASVIGGGPAATVIFEAQIQHRTNTDPRVLAITAKLERSRSRFEKAALQSQLATVRGDVYSEHHRNVANEFDSIHSVDRALKVGSLHEIVATAQLRETLIGQLDSP